jgi:hypothetical protein
MTPIFSICHATARPRKWKDSYTAWWDSCKNPDRVEYILAADSRWGFDPSRPPFLNALSKVHWCTGEKKAITGWNEAAAIAQGQVLIANSDDMRPPQNWDEELLKVIPDLNAEFVVEVSSGSLADDRRLMVLYILSRRRYEKLGYIANPAYQALWVDNEFTEHARQDGIVIDARHLHFHHCHPHQDGGAWDEVYASGNTPESWKQGLELFNRRKAAGFPKE